MWPHVTAGGHLEGDQLGSGDATMLVAVVFPPPVDLPLL